MNYEFPEAVSERIPNLAPMVDVIMVILIFFILGASLQLTREGVLQTQLDPRSGPSEGTPVNIVPAVKIALEQAGPDDCNIYVMGEPLAGNSFDSLALYLDQRRQAGADTQNPVVIAAQAGVRWKHVIAAMDASVRAGFTNVQFAVSLAGGTPRTP